MSDHDRFHQSVATEFETGFIGVEYEMVDWLDSVAMCYDLSTQEVAEKLLRHGIENYEDIL